MKYSDIGEVFLNFVLHNSLQAVCGMKITFVKTYSPNIQEWEEG